MGGRNQHSAPRYGGEDPMLHGGGSKAVRNGTNNPMLQSLQSESVLVMPNGRMYPPTNEEVGKRPLSRGGTAGGGGRPSSRSSNSNVATSTNSLYTRQNSRNYNIISNSNVSNSNDGGDNSRPSSTGSNNSAARAGGKLVLDSR